MELNRTHTPGGRDVVQKELTSKKVGVVIFSSIKTYFTNFTLLRLGDCFTLEMSCMTLQYCIWHYIRPDQIN